MQQSELRAQLRILVTRRGALSAKGESFPCMVQDMSDSGIQLISTRQLDKGQVLGFRCELFPEQVLDCKIEVVHVGDGIIGAKITEVDESGTKLIKLFLEEQFSEKIKRWD